MRLPFRFAVCGALAFFTAEALAGTRITGTAYTENSVQAVTVRAWALGEGVVTGRAGLDKPIAEQTTTPGREFLLELGEPGLPVRVEVSAPGHVAAAIEVVLPEQARLPVIWLPAGREVPVRVEVGGGPAPRARVWGVIDVLSRWDSGRPGMWTPVAPVSQANAAGTCRVVLPAREGSLTLSARAPDGRWGTLQRELPEKGALAVRLDSRAVRVAVHDERGEPVAGIPIAVATAPVGSAVLTDSSGKAIVQAPTEGEWAVVALGPALMGRTVGRAVAGAELALTAHPRRELRVVWSGPASTVLARLSWLPEALRGGAPLVLRGGTANLVFFAPGGTLSLWGPGVAPEIVFLRDAEPALAMHLVATARIDGRVVDSGGAGVAGVPVWGWELPNVPRTIRRASPSAQYLRKPYFPATVSGPEGRFTVADVTPGPARLTAVKPGLPPADSGVVRAAAGAVLPVTLTLAPGTWLALTVHDPDGRALGGVEARAFRVDPRSTAMGMARSGPSQLGEDPDGHSSTDREGRLRLDTLLAGDFAVELKCAGYVARTLEVKLPAEGKDLGVEVLEPGVTVAGRVLDEGGKPVADAEVRVETFPGVAFGAPSAVSDAQGHFAIADQPRAGELRLVARGENLVSVGPATVILPPTGPVELRVRRARVLGGRVVDGRDAEPVIGAQVVATKEVVRASFSSYSTTGEAESAEDGSFRIAGLDLGTLTLRVGAPGFKEAVLDVTIADEGPPRLVTVVLKRGLSLMGRVEDSQGAAAGGITVVAEPASSGPLSSRLATYPQEVRTDPEGRFVVVGLDPGRFQVTAIDDAGARASEVVEAGRQEELVLRLRAPGSLLCRVLQPEGTPIEGAEVRVLGTTAPYSFEPPRRTDATGQLLLEELSPQRYRVFASAERLASATREVVVEAGQTAELQVALARGGTLLGRVVGLSAEQLARLSISAQGTGDQGPKPDGSFRRDSVPLGEDEVSAYLMPEGTQRSARYTLTDLNTPANVELDFAAGVTLTGAVRRGGRPGAWLNVEASAPGGQDSLGTTADGDGRYELKGVEPGEKELRVTDDVGRTLLARKVTVNGDTRLDLDVPGGEITGRVLDAKSRAPLPQAQVWLRSEQPPVVERTVQSEDSGAFRVSDLADGSYTVRATAPGYTPDETPTALSMGRSREVTLALEPEQRLVLLLREADGAPPDQVMVVPMREGRVEDPLWLRCDGEGRAIVTSLLPGVFTLLVTGRGAALIRLAFPGAEAVVQLRQSGRLSIIPLREGATRVRLVGAVTGLTVPVMPWQNPGRGEWVELLGSTLNVRLPAGTYTLQCVGSDGVPHERAVAVPGEGEVTVHLETS